MLNSTGGKDEASRTSSEYIQFQARVVAAAAARAHQARARKEAGTEPRPSGMLALHIRGLAVA